MSRFSDQQLADLRDRHPVHDVAGEWVKLRRLRSRKGFTHQGPCIACSSGKPGKGDVRAAYGPDKWACAACGLGGGLFHLWAARHGLDLKRDFVRIVEELGGVRDVTETPATAHRAGRLAHDAGKPRNPVPDAIAAAGLRNAWHGGWDKAAKAAAAAERYREVERRALHAIWERAAAWRGSPVETYLAGRGLVLPPGAKIRFVPDAPYFHGETVDAIGRASPRVIHRGAAMLAAIRDGGGVFRGLHFTWIDTDPQAAARRYKALISDPGTGEVLIPKKARGAKQGGYIDLGGEALPGGGFDRQFSGEGIESTAAVFTAMRRAGRGVAGIAWRVGIDIGNLAGAALNSEQHPTRKDARGRARAVPGRAPDLASPAMPVIAGCREFVQLGDADSDAFTTQCAMARGEVRRRAEGVPLVRTIWPPAGLDFNDWILKGTGKTGEAA